MPISRRNNKKAFIIATGVFLIFQTAIFANIPKDTDTIRALITVKNGTSLYNIATTLKEQGLIHSSGLFFLTSLLYRGKLFAGEYELARDMSTFDIVKKMGLGLRNLYILTIIEGQNIFTVAETVAAKGIMDKEGFLRLARDKGYLASIGISADSLEGYLTPDTYFYSKEIASDKFIERIAKKTIKFLERDAIQERMLALGLDTNKTVTMASIIEKEAVAPAEKPLISAVFHNRLRKRMSFDSDPTVTYGTRSFHSPITKTDLITHTPYNTYTFKGFPKGPICSPDRASIIAALNPAPVDYLYFVSKNDGTHAFSKDLSEHNRYVQMYQRSKVTTK